MKAKPKARAKAKPPPKAPKDKAVDVARALEMAARTVAEDIERIRKESRDEGLEPVRAEMLWKHMAALVAGEKAIEQALLKMKGIHGELSREELAAKLEQELILIRGERRISDEDRLIELEREAAEVRARIEARLG